MCGTTPVCYNTGAVEGTKPNQSIKPNLYVKGVISMTAYETVMLIIAIVGLVLQAIDCLKE